MEAEREGVDGSLLTMHSNATMVFDDSSPFLRALLVREEELKDGVNEEDQVDDKIDSKQ